VIALAVLGAGCSSQQQPSAVQVARKSLDHWETVAAANTKALQTECPGSESCGAADPTLRAKVCSDENHVVQAEAALDRAEGRYSHVTSNGQRCVTLEVG
jgi:hypothetical protein